jgi:hypothetical protein
MSGQPREVSLPEKPRLDERFVTKFKDKEFVLYAGLLDLAHQRGLLKLEVEPIQYPTKDNGYEAICKAVATSSAGEVFVDIGDANPNNTNKMIALHLLRMASTRAKARVLRDMNNIGMTALEELADIDDAMNGNGDGKSTRGRKPAKVTPIRQNEDQSEQVVTPQVEPPIQPAKVEPQAPEQRPRMSEAQKRAIANLSRRRGITESELHQMAQQAYGVDLEYLTASDAAAFIRQLQQSA